MANILSNSNFIIPNYFTKTHVEERLGRKLTKKQFQELKFEIEENMADEISELFFAWIDSNAEEVLEDMKEN